MKKRLVQVSGKAEIKTYAYLHESAAHMLEQAENSTYGQLYYCMNSNLLTAFFFEAYLNHIGIEILPNWEKIERKLSPIDKLSLIAIYEKIPIDMKNRPFQTIETVFKFRNLLVHGKSETFTINEFQKLRKDENIKQPMSWWQKQCKIKIAKRLFEDTESTIRHINKYVTNDLEPFISLGHGFYFSDHFQSHNKQK